MEIADALNVSAGQGDGSLLLLDSALNELGQSHPRQVQMIELTYFGGLDRREVAASLEVSEGTVDRDLRLAKAWLRNVLER